MPFTAPIIDKPLRITGFFTGGPGAGVNVYGTLVVVGLGPQERVEIADLQIAGANPASPAAIVAIDCQGDVLLEDVYLNNNGFSTTYAHVERCANVVFRGCELLLGGYPLTVVDSNVLLTTSWIRHSGPASWPAPGYPATTEGIRVVNSTVTAIGSIVNGEDEVSIVPWQSFRARPAVIVESGTMRVGPASTIRGGFWAGQTMREYGFYVLDPTVGDVRQDPRATVVRPPSATTAERMDAVFHSWVIANEPFGVTVAGPDNGFALLTIGDWRPGTPSPLGELALDPATAVPLGLVSLSSPGGNHQWTFQCPLLAPVAHAFALQALTIAPSGALGVTIPSPFAIGWPAALTP